MGAFEIKQATLDLKILREEMSGRSNSQQYHHMANRMLGDLEFRGHVRPVTEEFNLAGNWNPHDVKSAEFTRTLETQHFNGANLLRRLRAENSTRQKKREWSLQKY